MSRARVEQEADVGMRLYKIFRARGLGREQAAAWAANAAAESQGKYTALQNHGRSPGVGLFQWGAIQPALDRRRSFQRVFGHPIQQSTEEEQLAFRDWELAHTYASQARRIAQASSAGDIAAAVTRYYEGPQDKVHPQIDRTNIAEAIMQRALLMPDVPNSNSALGSTRRRGPSILGTVSGPVRQ